MIAAVLPASLRGQIACPLHVIESEDHDPHIADPPTALEQAPLQLDEPERQVRVTARRRLLEVDERTTRLDLWMELGPRHLPTQLGVLDGHLGALQLPPTGNGLAKTVRKCQPEFREIRGSNDLRGSAHVETYGQVQG